MLTSTIPVILALAFAPDLDQKIFPMLQTYVAQRTAEFDQIPAERQADLKKLAAYIRDQRAADKPVRLIFICTHNSRRSHLAQLWAAVAADHYGLEHVETFSGGTEATAFNPRAVAAIQRAGFQVDSPTDDKNPRYSVRFKSTGQPLTAWSKRYDDKANPQSEYAAIMTCSQADQACPVIPGADLRLALPYDDPKTSDDTPEETAIYDERTAQIARELLYTFKEAKSP
jgi:arsenate reductase